MSDHRSEYLRKISAKRDANAGFARALVNGVGHDTVNSKTTEQQDRQSEQCQQQVRNLGAATEVPITSAMARIFDTGWSLSRARISSRTGRERASGPELTPGVDGMSWLPAAGKQ
jgi:hypothetical protein